MIIKKKFKHKQFINNEYEMIHLGKQIAKYITLNDIIYFIGDIGTGKTTINRGILKYFGIKDCIKSPTYTIVEKYKINDIVLQHFDFYRLNNPEELEYLGINDYFINEKTISLIEWPDKFFNELPNPTKIININYFKEGRMVYW